jgi:hypothetical protein
MVLLFRNGLKKLKYVSKGDLFFKRRKLASVGVLEEFRDRVHQRKYWRISIGLSGLLKSHEFCRSEVRTVQKNSAT